MLDFSRDEHSEGVESSGIYSGVDRQTGHLNRRDEGFVAAEAGCPSIIAGLEHWHDRVVASNFAPEWWDAVQCFEARNMSRSMLAKGAASQHSTSPFPEEYSRSSKLAPVECRYRTTDRLVKLVCTLNHVDKKEQ